MKIYALGEQLIESTMEEILESSRQAVFIVSPNELDTKGTFLWKMPISVK